MKEVLQQAIDFAEYCLEELDLSYMASNQAKRLIEKSKEALAKQEHGEPVAWWIPKAEQFCLSNANGERPFAKAWEPLYTHPQPKREPLMLEKFREMEALLDDSNEQQHKTITDDELKIIMEKTMPVIDWQARCGVELNNGERNKWMLEWFIAFARAIEAAHGIKGGSMMTPTEWKEAQLEVPKIGCVNHDCGHCQPKAEAKAEPVACDGDFPEGFDESFGIPAQALRQANAALCEVTNNRMWDVPALAERMMLFRTHTTPPAAQPAPVQDIGVEQDERVFARIAARKNRDAAYKETAQREWIGLTDEERSVCINSNFGTGLWLMAKDIEAKLRSKNEY